MLTLWHQMMPMVVLRILNYAARLRKLGLSPKLSLVKRYRTALEATSIELLPRKMIASPKVIVDVGANVGDWSAGIALLVGGQRIIAYEPNPQVYLTLKERTAPFDQIECRQIAIGDCECEISLNLEQVHQLSSILELKPEIRVLHGAPKATQRVVKVLQRTLDQELKNVHVVSLLKLDIQGYERKVFEGAQQVLKRTEILVTEVTYVPCYDDDMQFQELLQYITQRTALRLWGVSEPRCDIDGRPIWADAVFVRPAK